MSATTKARKKAARARCKSACDQVRQPQSQAADKTVSDGPEPAESRMDAASAASQAEPRTAERPGTTVTHRELMRMKKELQVRIRELELEMVGVPRQDECRTADQGMLFAEHSNIVAMVKDLHGEIDASYEQKAALEGDLAAMRDKLFEEQAARAELEGQVKLLEAKLVLEDQLREDISLLENKRKETAHRLEEATSELKQVVQERDDLVEQKVFDEKRIREVQRDMMELEAKVSDLEKKVAETDHLGKELTRTRTALAEAREDAQRRKINEQNLKGELEAARVAKSALDLDLATTHELVRSQNEQLEELRDNLAGAHSEVVDLHGRLERQQAEQARLADMNKRAQCEIGTLSARNESMQKELDSGKQALHDIHAATVRTAARIRDRYAEV